MSQGLFLFTFAVVISSSQNFLAEVSTINFFDWWQLKCDNGRQVWHFSPPQEFQHIKFDTDEGREILSAMTKQFVFDKTKNPNSQDKVFRSKATFNTNVKAGSAKEALQKGWEYYTQLQDDDGHWAGDYGGPMFLLPGLIIVAHITQTEIPAPHKTLMMQYMLNHQNADGGWGLHLEGKSTMFGTCLQYVSLRILGATDNIALKKAQLWIHQNGGATGIPPWGKFYLSCLNVYEWEGCDSLLPELWLLPKFLPIHPSKYWCHARLVYLPMSYCFAVKLKAPETLLTYELRKELYAEDYHKIDWQKARDNCAETDKYHPAHPALDVLNFFSNAYEKIASASLRNKALNYAYKYIQAEDLQTNYLNIGPVNKVMNMLCVWHREGNKSEAFKMHKEKLFDYLWVSEDGMKMQGYNGSQFWDTAFAILAMKEAGIEKSFAENYCKAIDFTRKQQIAEEPFQWNKFFRHTSKGGFPFSTQMHGWPITDCTAEGVKILLNELPDSPTETDIKNLTNPVDVILSFQNKDGGWASYENTRAPKWIEALNPSQIFGNIMLDYSYTECTSASVQALVKFNAKFPDYRKAEIQSAIKNGIQFILKQQREDGSWYGSWAVCFTYGTWFAVEALYLVKKLNFISGNEIETAMKKAESFLLSKQMSDGGWGENFESCVQKKYIESNTSQSVNTAWALMALMFCSTNKNAIEKGIKLLIEKQQTNGDWQQEEINGVFNHNCMISYSNYRNIFPLWVIGRYGSATLTMTVGSGNTSRQ